VEELARSEEAGGLGQGFKLVADELTGAFVLTATPARHQKVVELLERLDAEAPIEGQPIRTFSTRNRSAVELADVLNRLIGTGFLSPGAPVPGIAPPMSAVTPFPEIVPVLPPVANQATPLPVLVLAADRSKVILTADAVTNTLLATGEAHLLDKVGELVKALDVMTSQVMLEVLILNLSDNDTVDLGVEIRALKDNSATIILSSLFGLGVPNPTAPAPPVPSVLSGFTGVVLDPGNYGVLVHALQVLNKGRALNIPKVLVNSNQRATLTSVLQTPFLSTNATNVVATTSFGGTQDAGTTIEVRPQIAQADHLVLEYSIVLSTFVGPSTDPSLPPPRQQNNLKSVATIPDGYTVALGGLETTSETVGTSQVPFLGKLPVIGWLFRSKSAVNSHSRFYVFIRASILRSADFQYLKFMSDVGRHDVDLEPSWPEVEPALIR
jgi:general secretion pathway protein D